MPLARYFAYVGSVLLALLLIADWWLPPPGDPAGSGIEHPAIRIHSAYKWPNAVVIDTTLPTVVPPKIAEATPIAQPPPVLPGARSAHDALALASDADTRAAEPAKPARRHVRRTRIARQPAARFAGEMSGFGPAGFTQPSFRNPWFAGW